MIYMVCYKRGQKFGIDDDIIKSGRIAPERTITFDCLTCIQKVSVEFGSIKVLLALTLRTDGDFCYQGRDTEIAQAV
jgi:hypothetical protein